MKNKQLIRPINMDAVELLFDLAKQLAHCIEETIDFVRIETDTAIKAYEVSNLHLSPIQMFLFWERVDMHNCEVKK